MAVRIILKNSSAEDKHPTSTQLDNGELALNYHEAGAFLSCRDTAGNIQQVGGVKISEDAPSGPVKGTFWFQPSATTLFLYDGTAWQGIAGGGGGGGGGTITVVGGQGIDASTAGSIVTIEADLGDGVKFDGSGRIALEVATASQLGGVKIGNGIDVTSDGTISVDEAEVLGNITAGDGIDITNTTISVDLAGGDDGLEISGGKLKGSIATATTLGVVKAGAGVDIGGDGTISVDIPDTTNYKGAADFTETYANNSIVIGDVGVGDLYINDTAGTANSDWTGIAGEEVVVGDMAVWDGSEWELLKTGGAQFWQRTGTTLSPVNTGDWVGINRTDANYPLHVTGTISTYNGVFRMAGTASPSGADPQLYRPATGEFGIWTGGGERLRIDGAGNVGIIGTGTAAQPNISLNADGSATFASYVATRDYLSDGDGCVLDQNLNVRRDSGAADAITVYSGGTAVSNKTANISGNGNATFAGDVLAGSPGLNNDYTFLSQNGLVEIRASHSNEALNILKTGSGTASAFIKTDGSASFGNGNQIIKLRPTLQDTDSGYAIALFKANGTDTNFSVGADGSALFAKDVEAQKFTSEDKTVTGFTAITDNANGNIKNFASYNTDTLSETFFVRGDGSATFAGKINQTGISNTDDRIVVNTFANEVFKVNGIGRTTVGSKFNLTDAAGYGVQLHESGQVYIQHDNTLSNNALEIYKGNALNASVGSDGSATFAGNITAGNVTFDAGTPEEFSIKERLVAARETFQELQIAVEAAADFASLKAAMLVALEDWRA